MPSTNQPVPPGSDASYGNNLKYWMTVLGLSDRDLAHDVAVNRTYPGQIQRGKVPSPETADRIREKLLERGRGTGRDWRPRLVASEVRQMDNDLRTSFAREDAERRQRAKRPADQEESAASINASITMASVAPPALRRPGLSPWASVGLIALALVLTFGAVVYYVTHASATLDPQQLHRTVIAVPPVFTDALITPSANGWYTGADSRGGCAYRAGAYHATVLHSAVIKCFPEDATPLPASRTIAVEVDVTFLHGDGGGGLVLCYAGTAPYYRFVVRPDGYFDLFDPLTPTTRTSGPPVDPKSQYRLMAIIQASTIYLYIDGSYLAQAPLQAGASVEGNFGVFAVDGVHNPTDVAFHNFKIWSL